MKHPDKMCAEERLRRIYALERQVAELKLRLTHADERAESAQRWAKEAFNEQRRLHGVLKLHWDDKERYRLVVEAQQQPAFEVGQSARVEDGRIGQIWDIRYVIDGPAAVLLDMDDGSKLWASASTLRRI